MLVLERVNKSFPGAKASSRALRDVTLEVEDGSFVVIVGANGSGKSALLQALMGTFPVSSGTIRLDGHDITAWPEHRRCRLIGRVWQDPSAGTAPNLSIADNLALAVRRWGDHGLRRSLDASTRAAIQARLRELHLPWEGRLDRPAASLGAADRQVLALLMATWGRPRLLLLDDHTADLDPQGAAVVLELTRRIIQQEKLTALLVTQVLTHAVNLGDRLLVMHRGEVVHDLRGAAKRRLRVDDLLARFEELRCGDLMDESVSDLLRRAYV